MHSFVSLKNSWNIQKGNDRNYSQKLDFGHPERSRRVLDSARTDPNIVPFNQSVIGSTGATKVAYIEGLIYPIKPNFDFETLVSQVLNVTLRYFETASYFLLWSGSLKNNIPIFFFQFHQSAHTIWTRFCQGEKHQRTCK